MSPIRAMVVIGTRPEAIKLAPVVLGLKADSRFLPVVVATGQHQQMLEPVMDTFGIEVDHDLDIGQHGQTLTDITTRALRGIDGAMADVDPDVLIVQGDTTTTFTGALAGFYHQRPVVHVEAGLRTGNPRQPFPEEINRRLTTSLTTLHLAPTPNNVANLLAEGISRSSVVCTGNTVIDALYYAAALPLDHPGPILEEVAASGRRLILVTVHRRESWGEAMAGIGRALARVAQATPDALLVLPAHPNPRVRATLLPALEGIGNVRIVEPVGYRDFAGLLARADLVITDSGGIQEEAPSLGIPVLVLREVTERGEAVAAGTVELIGTDEERIVVRAAEMLSRRPTPAQPGQPRQVLTPYGDGQATERSVAAIAHLMGRGEPAREWIPPGAPA